MGKMKFLARSWLMVALCLAVLAGCSTLPPTLWVSSTTYAAYALYWQQEVGRTYPGAVMVAVHGRTGPDGRWWVFPDRMQPEPVVDLIARIRVDYPHRTIVMIACNPGGHRLPPSITNVAYALTDVWSEPDSMLDPREATFREFVYGDLAGSLAEFIFQ